MKPFRFGDVVPAEFQCPQPVLLKTVLDHLASGQKVLLQGERRMGKTSFVRFTVAPRLKRRLFHVSLWGVKTVDDLTRQCLLALQRMKRDDTLASKAARILKERLGPSLAIGGISIAMAPATPLGMDVLESVLDEVWSEHQVKPVFAFWDEFQEILKMPGADDIIGRLRSMIQHHTGMAYVFAGSDRNRMHGIFNHPKSPFFKGAATMEFDRIGTAVFTKWLRTRFALGEVTVPDAIMEEIFTITDRVSGDVQQLCSALWDVAERGATLGERHLAQACRVLWGGESRTYEMIVGETTALQMRCLRTLARLPGIQATGSEFLRESGASSPSSVARALDRLVGQSILRKRGATHTFVNPFFRLWLNRKE
ncbi:MAG: hypothetical protein LBK99_15070 [Opitutaceae bacterium]|jgi:hypothetical protein|nr:hypothetical protein [Opitutaceae bacterium]